MLFNFVSRSLLRNGVLVFLHASIHPQRDVKTQSSNSLISFVMHVQFSHICFRLLNPTFVVVFRVLMDLQAIRMCAYTTLDFPSSTKG